MDLMYYIVSPFSWLLNFFYGFFENYGIAIILFAVVVKVIMFPLTMKGKKGMIQMNMVAGKQQQLQKQYGKDQQRYQMELQKLYEKEKVNPMSGCLWSFLPIFILLPLYAIIRQPLKYLMGLTADQIQLVAGAVDWSTAAVSHGWIKEAAEFANTGYNQLYLSSLINESTLPAVTQALGEGTRVFAVNFQFLGLDLAMMPTWKIWENPTWPVIGAFLMILISVASSVIMSKISMKTNQMSSQTQNEQVEKTNRTMMWVMPIMSLYIGFIMPVAMCLYWIANSLLSMVQEVIAGRMLKKDYEAARAAAAEREAQEKEEEKRRKEEARLERARRLEEEKKNKGKKKPAQKKESEPGVDKNASREGIRAYARGRAYDPNRFGGVTPYHDPNEPARKEETGEEAPAEAPEEQTAPVAEETPVLTEAPAAEEVSVSQEAQVPEEGQSAEEAAGDDDDKESV